MATVSQGPPDWQEAHRTAHQAARRIFPPALQARQHPPVDSPITRQDLQDPQQDITVTHGAHPTPNTVSNHQLPHKETVILMQPNPTNLWERTLASFSPLSQHALWSLTISPTNFGAIVSMFHTLPPSFQKWLSYGGSQISWPILNPQYRATGLNSSQNWISCLGNLISPNHQNVPSGPSRCRRGQAGAH